MPKPPGGTRTPVSSFGKVAVRYGAAPVLVAVALLIWEWLSAAFGPLPGFITFYPVVMITALLSGFYPALLATLLSGLSATYWTLPPYGEWRVEKVTDLVALAIFSGTGIFMAAIAGLYRKAQRRVARYEMAEALREGIERSRKREEETLRRYQLVAANSRDIILFVRRDSGRILEANAAATKAYGYSLEELLSLTVADLRAPAARGSLAREMAVADESGILFETVHRSKDGSTFPVEVSSQAANIGGVRTLIGVVRDITERKQAGAKLAAERERLAVTLGSIGDAVIATDQASLVTVFNGAAQMLTGFTAEEAIGHPVSEVFHIVNEDTRQPAVSPVDRVLCEGIVVGLANHTALVARDGSERPIADSGAPIRDGSGRVSGVVLVFRDQTEERRKEETLRHSEERFRALVTASSNMVYRMSPDWSEMRQLRGREFIADTETVSSTWLQKYIHPDDQPRVLLAVREAIRKKDIFELEHRVLRVDGSLGWTLSRAVPLLNANGEILEWFGAASDATERKVAEEALATAKERVTQDLDAMMRLHRLSTRFAPEGDLAPVLAEIVDAAIGITHADMGHIQLLDPASRILRIVSHRGFEPWWLESFGCVHEGDPASCGAALQQRARVIVEDVTRSPIFAGTPALQIQLRAGVRAVQSTPLFGSSGQLMGMLSTHYRSPRRPDERDLRLLDLLARQAADMIERAQAVDAVRRTNHELKEADRRKSEFLAVLSHELRNPLAPIRNSIYLLERAAPGSEQAERAKEVIRRQTEHLTRLIDDLLDVTRISKGKIELQRRVIDLREVVCKTTDDLFSLFQEREVELRVQHSVGPIWVDADATRLTQVVGNLLQNAVKFTPSRGTVSIGIATHDERAEIYVRDTGVGMEPDQVERMFEPFAQAGHGLARTQGGLGLGLALVKGLVELHGGTVRALSEGLGRGAEFVFALPIATPAIAAPELRVPVGTGGRLVLIIEDNADAGQSLAEVLELSGHRVRVARNGRSGLNLARELRPEVILCDIGLPDLNGFELARTIRADDALRSIRLIALSGYAQKEDRRSAEEAGFDAHIPKPPALDALLAAIAK